jgi:integrase
LRDQWHRQQKQRLALGLGKAGLDDLVFARPDASPWALDSVTADWARPGRMLRLPEVTPHSLRHAHVSVLIAAGLDVVTVSGQIGHSDPTTTFGVYAHLFGNTNDRAAAAVEAALAHALAG